MCTVQTLSSRLTTGIQGLDDILLDGITIYEMSAAESAERAQEDENTLYVPAEVELGERMRALLAEVDPARAELARALFAAGRPAARAVVLPAILPVVGPRAVALVHLFLGA